jgi:hypothetical protein
VTDDEEKRLKQELLALDVSLRRKQEFWETPRNIAILVGLTAAIAAAIGFCFGRASIIPPAPGVTPATIGSVNGMTGPSQFIDIVQTTGIVVIAFMVVYVVLRLDRTLTAAAEKIQSALTAQSSLAQALERIGKRLEAIERLVRERNEILPTDKLRLTLEELRGRLDQLEKGRK